jgi:hypothetical protein
MTDILSYVNLRDFAMLSGDTIVVNAALNIEVTKLFGSDTARYYGNATTNQETFANVTYGVARTIAECADARSDFQDLKTAIDNLTATTAFPSSSGDITVSPGIYKITGPLSNANRSITFNANGNPNAKFYIISDSAITFTGTSSILLTGDASAYNIYFSAALSISFAPTFVGSIKGIYFAGTYFINNQAGNRNIFGNIFAGSQEITLDGNGGCEFAPITVASDPDPPTPTPDPGPEGSSDPIPWGVYTIFSIMILWLIYVIRK